MASGRETDSRARGTVCEVVSGTGGAPGVVSVGGGA